MAGGRGEQVFTCLNLSESKHNIRDVLSYLKLPQNQSKNILVILLKVRSHESWGFPFQIKQTFPKPQLEMLEMDLDLTLEVKELLIPQCLPSQDVAPTPQLSKLQKQESPLFPFLSSTFTSNLSASPQLSLQNMSEINSPFLSHQLQSQHELPLSSARSTTIASLLVSGFYPFPPIISTKQSKQHFKTELATCFYK